MVEVYKDVKDVHSLVFQNVGHHVKNNIMALSENKKKGHK